MFRLPYPVLPASDHYDPATGRFFVTPPQAPVQGGGKTVLRWLKAMTLDYAQYAPPAPMPSQTPDWQALLQDDGTPRFVWFGHSTVLARLSGITLLLDPVFGNCVSPIRGISCRYQQPPAALDELPPIDYILISHNHYDHLDKPTIRRFVSSNTRFIVPLNLGTLLQHWGIGRERITELDWWQHAELSGCLHVHAVPARHNSSRGMGDFNKTLWAGFVLQTERHKIYFSGDSSYGSHFADIGRRFGALDLAMLENGQYNEHWRDNHMFPEQTAQAAADVQARRFMPIHWGMFSLALHPWDEPVRRSIPLVRQSGIATLTPTLGQVFTLDSETHDWWENVGA